KPSRWTQLGGSRLVGTSSCPQHAARDGNGRARYGEQGCCEMSDRAWALIGAYACWRFVRGWDGSVATWLRVALSVARSARWVSCSPNVRRGLSARHTTQAANVAFDRGSLIGRRDAFQKRAQCYHRVLVLLIG